MCRGSIDVEHCFQKGPPPRGGGQPRVDRAIKVCGDVIDGDAPSGKYGRFLKVANTVGNDSCRNEDQEQTGDIEENREVDASGSGVDQPADNNGDEQTRDHPKRGGCDRVFCRGFDCCPHEERGFNSFSRHCNEGDPYDSPIRARGQLCGGVFAKFARELAGV